MRHLRLLVLAAVIAALGAGSARAAVQTLTPTADTISSHFHGYTAWSAKIDDHYRLLERDHGVTRLLSAPGAPVTQDPKIGPDARNRPVIVYQRCARATCTLWRYDLRGHADRAMSWLGHPTRRATAPAGGVAGQTLPTLWHGRVAFQTHVPFHGGSIGQVRIGPSGGPGPVTVVPAGPTAKDNRGDDALGLALSASKVLIAWTQGGGCGIGISCSHALLDDLGTGRQRVLDEGVVGGGGCYSQITNPYFSGQVFAWLRVNTSDFDSGCPHLTKLKNYNPKTGVTKTVRTTTP